MVTILAVVVGAFIGTTVAVITAAAVVGASSAIHLRWRHITQRRWRHITR